jgi:hypothetical protein
MFTKRDAMAQLQHRDRVRAPLYAPFSAWAALSASIIAGLVFAVLDAALGWALRGISPLTPLRMIGAIVLGPTALSPPNTFDATIASVAIVTHLMLSIAYGTLLALVMPAVDMAWGLLLGGFYGLALYYINFYGFNAFSPWFAEQRDWVSVGSHFVFGAVLAYSYTALNTRKPTRSADPATRSLSGPSPSGVSLDSNGDDSDLRCVEEKLRTLPILLFNSPRIRHQDAPLPFQQGPAVSRTFCPRLAEARHLLPLLRSHLIASALRHPLAAGLVIDLLPIVEDGLFGYELVPDRKTHTYVTLGCNGQGEPVLRQTLYGVGAPNTMQLVAVNGHILSRSERAAHYSTQQRDYHFADWPAAAESAWAHLLSLFPERPRQPVAVREHTHRCLDEALLIAHSHLAHWNPFIQFRGLPNEAQHGFALTGAKGEHGELVFQRPDIWMLRWKAPPRAVYESWSVVLPDEDAANNAAHRDRAS